MCNLGPDGRRQDVLERAELCKGSVEYVAPEEYMVRPPMPPVSTPSHPSPPCGAQGQRACVPERR
eukprot:1843085-Pyramimonas_sp.AAC.1